MISSALTSPLAVLGATAALVVTGGIAASAASAADGAKHPSSHVRPTGASASAPAGTAGAVEIGRGSVRLSGADRYATAADVSRTLWPVADTVETVYLASGEGFADALAIGPSTYADGPLLLTRRDELPAATVEEMQRLAPCYVVVVGGTAAISDAVADQADALADPTACEG